MNQIIESHRFETRDNKEDKKMKAFGDKNLKLISKESKSYRQITEGSLQK